MTRLAVLADIHANLVALEAVIADMAQFEVDQVIVAGDSISAGPYSPEVLERITSENWAVIRGNHEFYLLDYRTPREPASWSNYTLPKYLSQQLAGRWHQIVASLPDSLTLYYPDTPPVRVVHGSPRSHWEPLRPDYPDDKVLAMLQGVEEETVIHGHYHLANDRQLERWHLVNPGSVGVPLDGIRKASYAIMEGDSHGWRATIRRVDFDYERLFDGWHERQFIEHTGLLGHMLKAELLTARVQIIPFYRWCAENHPDQPQTLALFQEFQASDRVLEYTDELYRMGLEVGTQT